MVQRTDRPPGYLRSTVVLREEDLGHYDEFRRFFVAAFMLDSLPADGGESPCVRVEDGGVYELVFLGRSGKRYPSGIEVRALTPRFEPLDEELVDRDLWMLLTWVISNVGGDWTVEDLERTGRLYRIPWVPEANEARTD